MSVNERARGVAELLHTAGETHHVVYADVDGADDDWATWYSDWLVNHSSLPELLGAAPARSQLTYQLVSLDREFATEQPGERWEDFYAVRLIERLGTG